MSLPPQNTSIDTAIPPDSPWLIATRFQPGESGNPKGRSSEPQKAAHLLSKALCERLPQVGTKRSLKTRGRTYTQQIADVWIEQSLNGNIAAILSLSNRVEGTPPATLTVDRETDNLALILAHMDERREEIGAPEGVIPRRLNAKKSDGAVIDQ
jgi:Family of unknown function (DUF5681)